MEKVSLKPKSRVNSKKGLKEVSAENEAVLEVRRILNSANIHRVSNKRLDGYTHVLKESNHEYILLFSAQSKEGGDKKKIEIARNIFDLFKKNNFDITFSRGEKGVRVVITRSVIEKKLENTNRTITIKNGNLEVNSSILLDEDTLIQLVLAKSDAFQATLISKIKPSITASVIEKALSINMKLFKKF